MREILFRGKKINSNEWVEGYYFHQRKSLTDEDKHSIVFNNGFGFHWRTIVPETVGQYTGLTDKNGKKIFEGDIVVYEDEAPGQFEYHDDIVINRGVIEYCEGAFYWTNAVSATFEDSIYKGKSDCEVIGNIFDNPDLITSEKGAGV